MARDYKVVSTDDHITEPPGMFDGRLPKEFADRTPKVVRTDEGADAWDIDGDLRVNSGLSNAAGQKVEEFSPKSKTFEAMRPGCYDAKERLKDMDIDGVDAHVCFASLPGIAGGNFHEIPDKKYALALIRAYNDWLAEDFAATDPDRLIPMAVPPLWDLEEAGREIRRAKEKGLRGVAIPSAPHTFEGVPGYPDAAWEPVWDALEETGMPAAIHIVSAKMDLGMLQLGAGSTAEVFVHLSPSSNAQVLSTLLFSGILRKHPKLIFVSAESGIGWLPYFIERADYTHRKHRFWTGSNIEEETPSELFRRHFLANFISDKNGIEMRHMIGVDNIMIGTDYPHTDTSWPDTHRVIKEQMGDIPDDERAKICALNAVRIFGLDHQPGAS